MRARTEDTDPNGDRIYRDEILNGLYGLTSEGQEMPAPYEPPTDEMPVVTGVMPQDVTGTDAEPIIRARTGLPRTGGGTARTRYGEMPPGFEEPAPGMPEPDLPPTPGPGAPPAPPPPAPPPPPDTGPINDWPDPIPGWTPGGTTPAPGTGTTPSPTSPTSSGTGLSDAMRSRLMELIAMDPTAVSIDDPSLAPASLAFRRAQERSVERQREAAAERANAQGLGGGSGSLDAYTERAIQASGNAQASHDAGLVINELTQRRDQLVNMLKITAGVTSSEQDAQIRMQIANLNAELERLKVSTTASEGQLERDLRDAIAELQYGD